MRKKSVLDIEWTPELKEKLKNIKFPQHTKNCFQIIVGGVRPSCPNHPHYWGGPRKVWRCSSDCPIAQEEKKDGKNRRRG